MSNKKLGDTANILRRDYCADTSQKIINDSVKDIVFEHFSQHNNVFWTYKEFMGCVLKT